MKYESVWVLCRHSSAVSINISKNPLSMEEHYLSYCDFYLCSSYFLCSRRLLKNALVLKREKDVKIHTTAWYNNTCYVCKTNY